MLMLVRPGNQCRIVDVACTRGTQMVQSISIGVCWSMLTPRPTFLEYFSKYFSQYFRSIFSVCTSVITPHKNTATKQKILRRKCMGG